jgi:hypothetical protein
MNRKSTMFAGMLMLTAALAACQKKDEQSGQGPAQKAGAQIDSAASKAGEEMKQAGEKAGQVMQDAGKKLEDKSKESQQPPPEQTQK